MSRADYCPNTPEEIREMLDRIGVDDIGDLFGVIPPELRARSFEIPPGKSELELMRHMEELADGNGPRTANFIGGGYYDHFIPAVVDHLAGRAEFYTSYTPYQA
ncbi:MAG TPA: glycine dehydrogenase, partial [Geobacteraceae bacterium]|nr:glycine dehydrogenase [Geobacteraceae bacterium]